MSVFSLASSCISSRVARLVTKWQSTCLAIVQSAKCNPVAEGRTSGLTKTLFRTSRLGQEPTNLSLWGIDLIIINIDRKETGILNCDII